jgi:hypothetical protein
MKVVDAFLEEYKTSLTFLTIKQILTAYDLFVRDEHEECKKYIKELLGF